MNAESQNDLPRGFELSDYIQMRSQHNQKLQAITKTMNSNVQATEQAHIEIETKSEIKITKRTKLRKIPDYASEETHKEKDRMCDCGKFQKSDGC